MKCQPRHITWSSADSFRTSQWVYSCNSLRKFGGDFSVLIFPAGLCKKKWVKELFNNKAMNFTLMIEAFILYTFWKIVRPKISSKRVYLLLVNGGSIKIWWFTVHSRHETRHQHCSRLSIPEQIWHLIVACCLAPLFAQSIFLHLSVLSYNQGLCSKNEETHL